MIIIEFIVMRTSFLGREDKPLDIAYLKSVEDYDMCGQPKDEWCINIEDLKQLIDLSQIEGEIIIRRDLNYNLPVLEIYDYYRE